MQKFQKSPTASPWRTLYITDCPLSQPAPPNLFSPSLVLLSK